LIILVIFYIGILYTSIYLAVYILRNE